jgi:hypothetical protein
MASRSESGAKWAAAEADLDAALRPLLRQFRADYDAAAKLHTAYKGGANPGILAELIRQGWRKPGAS